MILAGGFQHFFFGTLLTISVHHMRRADLYMHKHSLAVKGMTSDGHAKRHFFYCLFVQNDKKKSDVSKFEGEQHGAMKRRDWTGISQWRSSQARTKDVVTLLHGSGIDHGRWLWACSIDASSSVQYSFTTCYNVRHWLWWHLSVLKVKLVKSKVHFNRMIFLRKPPRPVHEEASAKRMWLKIKKSWADTNLMKLNKSLWFRIICLEMLFL